jgi:tetratricopeptide (TPR) repeat protein
LNKALSIDSRNVEGLVARGALYANSGSFKKAVEDFETALKLNPSHANARKYMGETLVALGRSFEEENKIEEAKKAYQNCLNIIPIHEEAQHSLDYLKNKTNNSGKPIVEPGELVLPGKCENKV